MLSQDHFYWEMTKKYIVAFYHLFDDVHVIRTDKNGQVIKDILVPCSYVGKQKMFYLLQRKEDVGGRISTTLPRMSFLITGLAPDPSRKESQLNEIPIEYHQGDEDYMYSPVPFNFTISFSVWAEYQDDILQIIEQVGTFFRPDHTFYVEEIPELDIRRNISIVLNGMNLDIVNEFGDEEDRNITADMDFTLKGYLYPPISNAEIIKIINVRFTDYNDRCLDLANVNHTFDEICAVNKEAEKAMSVNADIEFDTEGESAGPNNRFFVSGANIQTNISSDISPDASNKFDSQADTVFDITSDGNQYASSNPTAGPYFWFDASAITGLSNGDPVPSWPDLSGNGFDLTQGNPTYQPTYLAAEQNGLPVIQFNAGGDSNLRQANPINPIRWDFFATIFIVIRMDAWVLNQRLWDTNPVPNGLMAAMSDNSPEITLYRGTLWETPGFTVGQFVMYTVQYKSSGQQTVVRVNGVQQGTGVTSGLGNGGSGFVLGGAGNVDNFGAPISVAELLVYNGIEDPTVNEQALMGKWGIS
jgi:hypothetical protein